jgi:hypothetical protein
MGNRTLNAGEQLLPGIIAPRVSLIIVHYRTPETLEVALRSIEEARISVPYEVIVIDNDPMDDAAERICEGRPAVIYVMNAKNVGFGRAVNQGLAQGRGEYLLVLNPDVEVHRGSVEELIDQAERDPSAGLIAPKLLYPDGTIQDSCRTFYTLSVFLLRRTFLGRLFPNHRLLRDHLMLDFDHATTRQVDWCLGASLLARRRAVEDVGPMDERFFLYFEDVDWCYRMAARGWKVLYHPAAVMTHRYARESARGRRGLWIHLASTLRYYEKWSFILYWLKLRSSTIRRIVLVLSDLIAVNLAFVAAYGARALSTGFLHKPLFGLIRYSRFLFFSDAVAVLALALAGMYRSRRSEEGGEQLLGAARAMIATALIMMASTFLFANPVYSRVVVTLFLPLAMVLVLAFRWGIFHLQGSVRSRRIHLRRIGLLAPAAEADEILRRTARRADLGLEILPLTSRAALIENPRGSAPANLEDAVVLWVQDERLAEVTLFEDWPGGAITGVAERLAREGIPVRLVPRARAAMRNGSRAGDFLGFPAFQLSGQSPTARSWEKRLTDSVLALFCMILLIVPYAIAWLVQSISGEPMASREVIGRRGRTLTRKSLTPSRGSGLFALVNDFPTLLMWLRGEWSLVGIHPFESVEWNDLPESYRRFPPDAAPGWVTLAGKPGGQSLQALCSSNLEYAERWSLALDINLVLERLKGNRGNS